MLWKVIVQVLDTLSGWSFPSSELAKNGTAVHCSIGVFFKISLIVASINDTELKHNTFVVSGQMWKLNHSGIIPFRISHLLSCHPATITTQTIHRAVATASPVQWTPRPDSLGNFGEFSFTSGLCHSHLSRSHTKGQLLHWTWEPPHLLTLISIWMDWKTERRAKTERNRAESKWHSLQHFVHFWHTPTRKMICSRSHLQIKYPHRPEASTVLQPTNETSGKNTES